MKPKEMPLFRGKPLQILSASCRKRKVKIQLLRDLLEVQRKYAGYGKQIGITEDFDEILTDYVDSENGD